MEAFEFAHGALHRSLWLTDIDLNHFGSCHLSGIFHREAYHLLVPRFVHLEIRIPKGGVAEAVSKGETGFDILGVIPAVADQDALLVGKIMRVGLGLVCILEKIKGLSLNSG